MRIEIWSDVVCPWCYIGKRRLERALGEFEHPVEVVWRSFQLDPGAPAVPSESVAESLGRKYGGGPAAGQQMVDRVEAVAAEEGLVYRLSQAQRVGTHDAHRLLHLALAEGGPALQGALKEELLATYFTRAGNVADPAVLTQVAADAGLDAERVAAVLASDEYADEVESDIATAGRLGATGVPFFVVDGRFGISGAQPAEVLGQVLERAWAESHPAVELVGASDADACGPDGCAVPGGDPAR